MQTEKGITVIARAKAGQDGLLKSITVQLLPCNTEDGGLSCFLSFSDQKAGFKFVFENGLLINEKNIWKIVTF